MTEHTAVQGAAGTCALHSLAVGTDGTFNAPGRTLIIWSMGTKQSH